jgi:tetratricopeptide (TPR) repeat protein
MAQDTIKGLVTVSREEAQILLEAGYLYLEMKKYQEAEAVFEGAGALLPHSEVPHICLGNFWFTQGEHRKALAEHRAAQKKAPKAALPHAHAAEALFFLGNAKEAVAECNTAIKLDPTGPGAELARALLEAHKVGALPPKK